jgi:hypothetical protein
MSCGTTHVSGSSAISGASQDGPGRVEGAFKNVAARSAHASS